MSTLKHLLCLLLILCCLPGFGQTQSTEKSPSSLLSVTLTPSMSIPLGGDNALYAFGGGAEFSAAYRIPFLPLLFLGGSLGYSFVPLKAVTSLSLLGGGLDAGVHIDVGNRLSIRAFGTGGYFYAFLNDGTGRSGANPFVSGGADITYTLFPGFSARVGAAYRNHIGLYNDLSMFLGASCGFPRTAAQPVKPVIKQAPEPAKPAPLAETPSQNEPATPPGTGLEVTKFEYSNVFPVFYKYYNDHPVGKLVLRNQEKTAAEDIRVSFLVKQYMDNPKITTVAGSIGPGAEKEIELTGLFKSTILEISEPTLVSANITIEYTQAGKTQKKEITQALRIYDRNAMTWEDNRRAAAFVTARDPTVLKFSKNVTGMLKGKASSAVISNLLTAIGIHQALDVYGIHYVVDPTTPYKETSQSLQAVDFLQFPQQTLEYKAGDCDDLSILYSALLESVGVKTAFITIPGHIYMAFDIDMRPDGARKAFQRADDLIFIEDTVWVPVEITERTGGFLKAWESGAKEWRENRARNQANLYPIHESWGSYESVGFSSAVVPINMPMESMVVKAYADEVTAFIDREISQRVASIQAEIKKAQDPTKATNKLGILYAQYGLYDRAEREFTKLVGKEYVPALINMGNILLTRSAVREALGYFQRAQKKEPKNQRVLLSIARANHELENYGEAKIAYAALKEIDPDLAGTFAYLDLRGEEAARAAEISQAKGVMVWEDEK